MSENKFYICKHCGNLVGMINSSGVPMICCGEEMTALVPGSVEASVEKHLPVVTVSGGAVSVSVGSALHPMTKEHLIEWVYLKTDKGGQRRTLGADIEPKAEFKLTAGEKPLEVYAYCNLHGLWKTEL
ncbi:MAG: desulfoferrodoxin [Ruminococcaceae bacterium]|nr:desulfoferrodoxin [Oscillospiraceae bacterium]